MPALDTGSSSPGPESSPTPNLGAALLPSMPVPRHPCNIDKSLLSYGRCQTFKLALPIFTMVTSTPDIVTLMTWISPMTMMMKATPHLNLGLQTSKATLSSAPRGSFVSYILLTNTGKFFHKFILDGNKSGLFAIKEKDGKHVEVDVPDLELLRDVKTRLLMQSSTLNSLNSLLLSCQNLIGISWRVWRGLGKVYVISMFLNPSIHFLWIEAQWEPNYIQSSRKIILQCISCILILCIYAEFQKYASGKTSSQDIDILRFWEANRTEFPTLFTMAMDYLPVKATSVPCKHVFSSAKETDTAKQNWISPLLMEALQLQTTHPLVSLKYTGTGRKEGSHEVIVLEHLRTSLGDLVSEQQVDHRKAFLYASQVLSSVESLHAQHYIHRDLKPGNFMVQVDKDLHPTVFLINLGLVQLFCNPATYLHAPYSTNHLIHAVTYLGWMHLLVVIRGQSSGKKSSVMAEELCKGLPAPFCKFVNHVRLLDFNEKPDYQLLHSILLCCLATETPVPPFLTIFPISVNQTPIFNGQVCSVSALQLALRLNCLGMSLL
ncbi:kinase-like domain-containing protein [Lactarius pseudohatsudake]|nr:kinase-like domain-containing protein [Lactarius pseudohatsudake]